MILLFEENERSFSTIGLGVLKDALSCVVREKLNDEFSLSMEYPITGSNFDKIKNDRIICVKPNPYSEPQAFRIYNVTKAINGRVIVDANHISYDLNSIPVKAFSAKGMQDALVQIQNECIVDNPFKLSSDITRSKTFKTTAPFNLRALLLSDEDSIVSEFNAEVEFDNYSVRLLAKRGTNRSATVRYGHNMTDINHSLSTELLYNGIFPYYHTEKVSNETSSSDDFTKVYIVGSVPFQDGWLSFSKDGEPYHPVDESPVQVATEGEYKDKVYCWNTLYNTFQEKIYNEQVTIIQGLTEPSWLTIDWSHFPNIICKAARTGYYKKVTDTDWGDIKGVGDIVFEGSITSSGLMENLILSFSEVVPSKSSSENKEVSEIVDVQLDEPIIWIETNEAKSMLHDRILMVDLTSEFEEEPTQTNLKAKAEEFINKHKLGTIKHSTTLSFIDLSSSSDSRKLENLDRVELGDTVKVIYEDANIEVDLRVITTDYDVLANRYNSVELGEKPEKLTNSTIQNGDNVSSLTNDVGYATVTTVNKLIAKTVTADFVEALNAKLSNAQIKQLEVERIACSGVVEASQFIIDSLVAKLLVAEDAEISNTLTAGNIKVAGDISINSGQITITNNDTGTSFVVDREGNLTANSVSITGGTLNINDGVFEVTNDGVLTATAADITGVIRATAGEIAKFIISDKQLHYGEIGNLNSVVVSPGVAATIANLDESEKEWAFTAYNQFGVTKDGVLYAKNANIKGTIHAETGYIANFKILNDYIATYDSTTGTAYDWYASGNGIYLGKQGLKLGDGFKVTTAGELSLTKGSITISDGTQNFHVGTDGAMTANSVNITGGQLTIGGNSFSPNFKVTNDGILSAKSAIINGNFNISKGELLLGGETYTYQYAEVALDEYNYVKNVYYEKIGSAYVLSTGNFDSEKTYYKYSSGAKFYVSNDGRLTIKGGTMTIQNTSGEAVFYAESNGLLTVKNADITGTISATSGNIAGFIIDSHIVTSYTGYSVADPQPNADTYIPGRYYLQIINETTNEPNYVLSIGEYDSTKTYYVRNKTESVYGTLSYGTLGSDNSFYISTGGETGTVAGHTATLTDVQANKWGLTLGSNFGVTLGGNIYATSATLSGSITATGGNIAGFNIESIHGPGGLIHGKLWYNTASDPKVGDSGSFYISTNGLTGTVAGHVVSARETLASNKWGLTLGSRFGVTLGGDIYADSANLSSATITDATITNGSITSATINTARINTPEIVGGSLLMGNTTSGSSNYVSIASTGFDGIEFRSDGGNAHYSQVSLRGLDNWDGTRSVDIIASSPQRNGDDAGMFDPTHVITASCSYTYLYRDYARQTNSKWNWRQGIVLGTNNPNDHCAYANANNAILQIGYYDGSGVDSNGGTISGYPNDVRCPTGYLRDKVGPTVSFAFGKWDIDESTSNEFKRTDKNKGITIVVGRFIIAGDTWRSWDLSDYFQTIISVAIGCDPKTQASLAGSIDTALYYLDGTTVYLGNDRGNSSYVSCIVIGIPLNTL